MQIQPSFCACAVGQSGSSLFTGLLQQNLLTSTRAEEMEEEWAAVPVGLRRLNFESASLPHSVKILIVGFLGWQIENSDSNSDAYGFY